MLLYPYARTHTTATANAAGKPAVASPRRAYWCAQARPDGLHLTWLFDAGIYPTRTVPDGIRDNEQVLAAKHTLEQVTSIHNQMVPDLVLQLTGWTSSLTRRQVIIDATNEDDTQWFTRLCHQLPDRSVYVDELHINCNTRLPLHLLIPKLAECKKVKLSLKANCRKGEQVPLLIIENLKMLRRLSRFLRSPSVQAVDVTGSDDGLERYRHAQVQALLTHASRFTVHLGGYQGSTGYRHMLATEFRAARLRSLRIDWSCRTNQIVRTLASPSATLASLDYDQIIERGESLQVDELRAIQRLPKLHALRLRLRCFVRPRGCLPEPLLVQAMKLGATTPNATLPLDTLHIMYDELMWAGEYSTFDSTRVINMLKAVLSQWKTSILEASVSIVKSNGTHAALPPALVQLLQDSILQLTSTNRRRVQTEVQRLMRARHINEPCIASQVLQYAHKTFASSEQALTQ